jgi:hypothetical protein
MSFQIAGMITVVEYDGDEHYRHSLTQGCSIYSRTVVAAYIAGRPAVD